MFDVRSVRISNSLFMFTQINISLNSWYGRFENNRIVQRNNVSFLQLLLSIAIIRSSSWNAVLSLVRVFWALCCNVEMETVDWRGESPAWSQLSVILHPITILYLTSNYPSPQRTRFQDSLNTVSNYHQLSDSEAALYGNIFQFRLKSSSGKHGTVRKKVDSIVV